MESENDFQFSLNSPALAECLDSPEYRYFVRTMGNPALKLILDNSQKEFKKKEKEEAKKFCKIAMQTIKMDSFEELMSIEMMCSSTVLYDYFLAVKANDELDLELRKLSKENSKMSQQIIDLKRSLGIRV